MPSRGEGGVGVRLSGAERPSVSPSIPTFLHQGGRSTRPPEPIECRTVLTFPRPGVKGYCPTPVSPLVGRSGRGCRERPYALISAASLPEPLSAAWLLPDLASMRSPVAGSTSNGPGRSSSFAISRTAGMTSSPISRRLRIASS
jgi:hypothetical protein